MRKTHIDVRNIKNLPEWAYIIRDVIEIDNSCEISTIITRPKYTRIYFSYRWFQFLDVHALKKAVKKYEERVQYQDIENAFRNVSTQETRISSNEFKEALTKFTRAIISKYPGNSNEKTMVIRRELK